MKGKIVEKKDKINTAKALWFVFKIQLEIFVRKMTTLQKQIQLLEKALLHLEIV